MTADERFDRIDANIERLSERIEASIARLDAKIDASIARLDAKIDASVARLDAKIDHLTQYVLDFREETARRLEIIDNRLDVMAANINNIEARFPTITKAILDFGKHTTQLTNDQAKHKNINAELVARMDSLEEKVSKLIHPAA
jgi:chromosome segregation ATPase